MFFSDNFFKLAKGVESSLTNSFLLSVVSAISFNLAPLCISNGISEVMLMRKSDTKKMREERQKGCQRGGEGAIVVLLISSLSSLPPLPSSFLPSWVTYGERYRRWEEDGGEGRGGEGRKWEQERTCFVSNYPLRINRRTKFKFITFIERKISSLIPQFGRIEVKERNRENWKYILPLSCCDELRMKKERESELY